MPLNHRLNSAIVLAACACLLSSCFTILQDRTKTLTVHTTAPAIVRVNNIEKKTKDNKAGFKLKKGKELITVAVLSDSTIKPIIIKPANAVSYYFDIAYFGIGFLWRNNPKRYTFPSDIYLKTADTALRYTTARPSNKGDVMIHLSLPYLNGFKTQPQNEGVKTSGGFMGFSGGIDYYHSKHQFVSLVSGGALDFSAPAPAPVDYSGPHESIETLWLALTNNYKTGHLSLGYGLAYSQNTWRYINNGRDSVSNTPNITKTNYAGGLMLNCYWQFGKAFNVGVLYRPSFIGLGNTPSRYEHFISLDLAWKIPVVPLPPGLARARKEKQK